MSLKRDLALKILHINTIKKIESFLKNSYVKIANIKRFVTVVTDLEIASTQTKNVDINVPDDVTACAIFIKVTFQNSNQNALQVSLFYSYDCSEYCTLAEENLLLRPEVDLKNVSRIITDALCKCIRLTLVNTDTTYSCKVSIFVVFV